MQKGRKTKKKNQNRRLRIERKRRAAVLPFSWTPAERRQGNDKTMEYRRTERREREREVSWKFGEQENKIKNFERRLLLIDPPWRPLDNNCRRSLFFPPIYSHLRIWRREKDVIYARSHSFWSWCPEDIGWQMPACSRSPLPVLTLRVN